MFKQYFYLKYNILLNFISCLSILSFLYPKKYRHWFTEQKKIFSRLEKNKEPSIWIHCSSLGEYEHIKALIPHLKKINKIINITFFSNSGYINFKDFELISQISHLPLDTKSNMLKFITKINPSMVIISKNDIWPNMIKYIAKNNIPMYVIGFKIDRQKIKSWLMRKYYDLFLSKFHFIFAQDKKTSRFLNNNNIKNKIIGDLRIQQVLIDSKLNFQNLKISSFIKNDKVIIYGSTENNDYEIIKNTILHRDDVKHIIVPHEINNRIISKIQHELSSNAILYSEINHIENCNHNILIIDVFGLLKDLYRYSNIAYIGGGFKEGVHNTLEPAIHGNLILFGPKHTNFEETLFFIEHNIACSIQNRFEFEKKINQYLTNLTSKKIIKEKIISYFTNQSYSVTNILNVLKEK